MRTSLNLKASGCLLAALLILTLPLKWLLAAFLAASFHEFCHFLVIKLLGGQVLSITIGAGGTMIECTPLSSSKELLCAIAGPIGSLFLLFFCQRIPRIALCAGVQAVFNLLPMFPLDGGRILQCIAEILLPEKWAILICQIFERVTAAGILLIALFGVLWFNWGFFPLVLTGAMLLKAVLRKIPCKEAKLNVQ